MGKRDGMSGIFTKDIVVLDVTSRLICAIVGVKKAQSVFGLKAVVEKVHSGYENGEWLDADETRKVSYDVLNEVLSHSASRSKRIFIGVPAEFVTVVTKEIHVTLDRKRRVVDADIDFLLKKGETFGQDKYVVINRAPVHYSVDTVEAYYADVRGMNASSLTGLITYVLCERSFTDFFDEIASSLCFRDIRYVSTAWAEGVSLFEKEERDNSYALLDVGYISSSVIIGRGDGVVALKSFSLGGGHISADMYQLLDVPFELAEQARDLVDLNLNYADDAIIVADADSAVYAADACEIVRSKLDVFAEVLKSVLGGMKNEFPSYAPVYLTGEGIAGIRGAKKYLSEQLGRTVEIATPKLPGYAKPCHASKISLLIVAETLAKFNFREFIKKIINGGKL